MSNEDYIDEVELTEEIPTSAELTVIIPSHFRGERLDKSLAACISQYSRSKIQTWIDANLVRYESGKFAQIKDQITGEQTLFVTIPEDPQNKAFNPENIPLEIVYSDSSIALINKPAGLVVHPAAGNWSGTLLNALLYHFPECSQVPRAGIVHRLDKDTSGLLVVAKSLIAQTHLVRQLQSRTVSRRYLALVWGTPPLNKTINAPIGRDPRDRLKMAVTQGPSAKEAITSFTVLQTVPFDSRSISLIECKLQTGRTHQIRVHLQHLGYPLLNDPVYHVKAPLQIQKLLMDNFYGDEAVTIPGQMLHATQLGLIHPDSEEEKIWSRSPPIAFLKLMADLGFQERAWQHLLN
ncbi:RluA family pseudouridine synthase [Polynucleobacter kasalickyi]|uniref:Pseudouridine synthase n=1 Tax=Polynucleobacter kasalickyi TaxID=1938817 RepID=A0A1W2BHL7_9BURK|nr:RluA family pseudouridine synthase [Polynucleobacter kasalickyi]SMC72439.1 ribosomal large subunit pseudouridine synthase D [Polynucleobacter kasalickyi]